MSNEEPETISQDIPNWDIEEVLAVYGEKTYDNGVISLGAVDGILYLPVENAIGIYYKGVEVGWLINYHITGNCQSAEEIDLGFQMSRGVHSTIEMTSIEEKGENFFARFMEKECPFTYGDGEFLLKEGIFDSEYEIFEEFSIFDWLLITQKEKSVSYAMQINTLFIEEETINALFESVKIENDAFTQETVFGEMPGEYIERDNLGSDAASRYTTFSQIRHELDFGGIQLTVPEGTVALIIDENTWELYSYDNYCPDIFGKITVKQMQSRESMEEFLYSEYGLHFEETDINEQGIWEYTIEGVDEVFTEDQLRKLENRGLELTKAEQERSYQIIVRVDTDSCMIVLEETILSPCQTVYHATSEETAEIMYEDGSVATY
jgi:hypothetical protein